MGLLGVSIRIDTLASKMIWMDMLGRIPKRDSLEIFPGRKGARGARKHPAAARSSLN